MIGSPPGARREVTAPGDRVGLLVITLIGAACSVRGGASSPEGAVRQFVQAARAGDREAVYRRLGPRTRAHIEELARRTASSAQVVLRPEELLSVGWAAPAWEVETVRTARREGDSADVEVASAAGDRQTVHVVKDLDDWKLEVAVN